MYCCKMSVQQLISIDSEIKKRYSNEKAKYIVSLQD